MFQLRRWRLDHPDSLRHVIARVNQLRRSEPALAHNHSLAFHPLDNDRLLAYSKRSPDGQSAVLVVVNLDPEYTQSGWVQLDLAALGLSADETFQVHDALSSSRYLWHGPRNFVQLDPKEVPAHLFRLRRKSRTERSFEYFL
jgi:starch synthase (maltosyl-transferring)